MPLFLQVFQDHAWIKIGYPPRKPRYTLPSPKLTSCLWKWMVGRLPSHQEGTITHPPTVSGNFESMIFLFLGFLLVPQRVLSFWGIFGPIFRGELLVWGSVESHIWRHTHLHVGSWVHPSLDESIGQLYLKWTDIITRKWITMDGGRIHT